MIVGLDIDGVVADFLPNFLQFVEQRVGNGPIPANSVTDWNFKDHPLLPEQAWSECMQAVSYEPEFWQNLSPLIAPKEWQTLDGMSRQGKLIFLTHRYERENYDIHEVTCDWLKRHGVSRPVVHFTQESKVGLVKELSVQLFVDDRYENCAEVAERTEAVVLMPHRLYNQSFSHPRVKRIRDFNELFAYLR